MSNFRNLDPAQYTEFVKQNQPFVLDVRTPYEYAEFHLPNSVLIPVDYLAERIDELPKERPILVLCAHGIRSAYASELLILEGFSDVINLMGGIAALNFQSP